MTAQVIFLAGLCAVLLVALGIILDRYYRLKLESADESGGAAPLFDEFLDILLELHDQGVSHSGSISREAFSRAVVESSCKLMHCGRGSLMLWDPEEGCLKVIAAKGSTVGKDQRLFLKPGEGIAGKAFETGQTIVVQNPEQDERYVKPISGDSEPFMSFPLLVKSKPIGVLNLHGTGRTSPFDDVQIKFLKILAGEAAVMLNNAELFERLESFYLEMVKTLARAVDSKDAYTHEHSDRASRKSQLLAKELQLSPAMARYVEYAALLHDIGKIGIDESILLKPGKLTPEEYEVMKKHPMIGHQILAPVQYLGPVAEMVLYHQEWYNGQGYPEGLKGEQIPLGARIVAVIDAWDAMTSDRPYRKALSREIAIGELRRGAGTQFDPQVVEAFLKVETQEHGASSEPEAAQKSR